MNSLSLCLIVCVAFFLSTGEALKCYVCNSGIDKTGCVQSATQTLSPQFLKDCSEIGGEGKYTVCRKIDQDVPNSSDVDARVIRECGKDDPAANSCYQKAGFGGRQYVCACTADGCNSGTNVQVMLATLSSFVVVALMGPHLML